MVNNFGSEDVEDNSWNLPVSVSSRDFQSVVLDGWDAPRVPDGSLPMLPSLRLKAGSDLVDAGSDVGLPFTGSAPDLGAFGGGRPSALERSQGRRHEIRAIRPVA